MGRLGVGILDGLRFIEHGVTEFSFIQERSVSAQLGIAGNPDVGVGIRGEILLGGEDGSFETGLEASDFADPDRDDAGGTDNDGALLGCAAGEEREDLDGFAEAHFVGQQWVCTEITETSKPSHTACLVRTQVGR